MIRGAACAVGVLSMALVSGAMAEPWRGEIADAAGPGPGGSVRLSVVPALYEAWNASDEVIVERFPLSDGREMTLRLSRFEALAPDATIVVATPEGERPLPRPAMTLWGGSADEDPSLRVYLAVTAERLDGLVWSDQHTFVITSGPEDRVMPTVIYDMREMPEEFLGLTGGGCSALRAPNVTLPAEQAAGVRGSPPCRIAMIAIETDHETLAAYQGNTAMATEYLTRLMGAVSQVYFADVNMRLQIPYLRLWADPNDPWDQTDMGPQLDQFRSHWATNMRGVRRTLAHYLTFRGLGGGVAWVGTICDYDWGFGLSSGVGGGFPYPLQNNNNRNWPIFVTAHELGHNFGSLHTHDGYTPPIDGCGNGDCTNANLGTIMSYCHGCEGGMRNIVLTLGPQVSQQILSVLQSRDTTCRLWGSVRFRTHPRDTTVRRGMPVTLTSEATGPGVLGYRWFRNGTSLAGQTGPTLTLSSASLANAGVYTVQAFNVCSTVIVSNPATLTVRCRADFDRDGFVDFFDVDAYYACFEGLSCPAGESADFTGDGFVDFFDIDAFFEAFEGEC